ncbi:MAG: hypothetical protein H0U03_01120 [Actinobacteria bacterium]|nr:hypothetical protein [Actinomycetota bacterium]
MSAAERQPYADAIDSVALQFGLIGQPEVRRLLDRDPDAALKLIAGLPTPQFAAIEPLQRQLRRRRTARWIELLSRYTNWWTASERGALHSQWMFEQAVDVLAVSRAAADAIDASSGPEGMTAFRRFTALMDELQSLLNDARSYDAASGQVESDATYSWLVLHTFESLRQLVDGIGKQDRVLVDRPRAT